LILNFNGLSKGDRRKLKKAKKLARDIQKEKILLTSKILNSVKRSAIDFENEEIFSRIISEIKQVAENLADMSTKSFEHFDNNHHPLLDGQLAELNQLNEIISDILNQSVQSFKDSEFKISSKLKERLSQSQEILDKSEKNQIKRIKQGSSSTRLSLLYFTLLHSIENIRNSTEELLEIGKKTSDFTSKK